MVEENLAEISKSQTEKSVGKGPGPTPKGERTRGQILDGAIRVVAAQGVAAATHRAVAKEAGVSLSTTTYYFTSLDDLLAQAFTRLVGRMQSYVAHSAESFRMAVEQSGVTIDSPEADRLELRDALLDVVVEYLTGTDDDWRALLRAELRFFFEATHIERLSKLLDKRRAEVAGSLRPLPEAVGSDQAQLDAEILFDLLLLAVYNMQNETHVKSQDMHNTRFARFFGWILRV